MMLKLSMRILYLFLLIPFGMMVVDFFWWFYTDKFITGTNWHDVPRVIFSLGMLYVGGVLFVITESV